MIENLIVLGAGSAGLIAAISLKRKIPQLNVRVVRSPEIGVINVGESTTPNFPKHLFEYLGIQRKRFYELARPTWKLGIKFIWGSRGRFDYTFDHQLDTQWRELGKPTGYYCDDSFENISLPGALMLADKAFQRQPNGAPDIHPFHAFHIENQKFVDVLEQIAREVGVEFTDGKLVGSERGEKGISAIHLEDGQRLEADFFVDASGFRSELIGKELGTPFKSFNRSLFCDRAVVGGWERGDEPLSPYTTATTMSSGWAWQIDHEHQINCGHVFCSQAISDEGAVDEFHALYPKIRTEPRVLKFRTGCYEKQWVDNVVALGNSAGFVEPLEASALMVLCAQTQMLVDFLRHSDLEPTPTFRELYNEQALATWLEIRDFLAIHYKFNGMLDTPFWKQARAETDVSGVADFIEFYQENGPTGFNRYRLPRTESFFELEGFLVMMVGNQVPYNKRHKATAAELEIWNKRRAGFAQAAKSGLTSKEALAYVHHPGWSWHADPK